MVKRFGSFVFSVLFATFTIFSFPALAQSSTPPGSCQALFEIHLSRRELAVLGRSAKVSKYEWAKRLMDRGQLIYVGNGRYAMGTEFLATNEFDWFRTPFDNRPTDLVVGFGTNSAWEIAMNKSAKNFILADWSPNPLFAHAFIMAPLLRIAESPQQFISYLAAQKSPEFQRMNVKDLLEFVAHDFKISPQRVRAFVEFLASKKEISDDELDFLSAYYWNRTDEMNPASGPFEHLDDLRASHFSFFLYARYVMADTRGMQRSVLHNPELYRQLRALYNGNRVKYAWTEISDSHFYGAINRYFPQAKDVTISMSNIFEANYAGHTFRSMRDYLGSVVKTLGISASKPLTIYRTTNNMMPHGFYRYDIRSVDDIPKVNERDSLSSP